MNWKGNENETARHRVPGDWEPRAPTPPTAPSVAGVAGLARRSLLACGRLALLLTVPLGAEFASADELLVGERTIHRVQIIGYEAGMIEYRTKADKHNQVPLREVDFLMLDSASGMADLNKAEEYLLKGEPHQAVERYERALRATRGFWTEMVQVRLLIAANRAGLSEKAVRAFLTVAQRDPVAGEVDR